MGRTRLSKFKNFNSAIAEGDWVRAGVEGRDSLWHRQVTNRAERLMVVLEESWVFTMAKYSRFDPRNKKKDRHKNQYQNLNVAVKHEKPKRVDKENWDDGTARVK